MNGLVLVDTNILIDVLTNDRHYADWSRAELAKVVKAGTAFINQIILAELAPHFESVEALEAALPPRTLRRVSIPFDACFAAGQAYRKYRERGGARTAPLPDFFIGAHAQVEGMKLLTRDVRRFRAYFPEVELIAPPDELQTT